ncbi:MAG: hypothetical protein ABH883_00795 [Candidatus Omnitrophota bacterium]
MRKTFCGIFSVLLFACITAAPYTAIALDDAGKSLIRTEIDTMMKIVIMSAERCDVAAVMSNLSGDGDNMFFINSEPYDLTSLAAEFEREYSKMKRQTVNVISSKVMVFSPDAAAWIGYGKGRVEYNSGEAMDYVFSETWIWEKIKGKWAVTHYHESA